MSDSALKDLNIVPLSEGKITKAGLQKANDCNAISANNKLPLNEKESFSNGSEAVSIDVEYIESEKLTEIEDVDACMMTLMTRLESKDWVTICEGLNNVRQISLFHKEKLLEQLSAVILLVVKSLKNPRSAVCKTAIMTCSDIFKGYGDIVVESLDPLLVQLFLKSSQDKKFVCEAAEAALISMTNWVSPSLLLPKLEPYLKNRNPRVRAKACMCFSRSVPRLGLEGIKSYGIDKLIQVAATQLSDQLPESREAARTLALELQGFYSQFDDESLPVQLEPNSESKTNSWEEFCHAKLSRLSAQAILRVTTTQKESLVASC
ncbi:ARM repeat superfamily protein [Rhynchospora pubera]|uniref:ARM repeat superfamily protein n=1 Tax=Rhynchospora pubera TaxID=906938 RepID=A0AAV8DWU5_9POAL|nr:ARM repeat superfamily protein [Rhynchospora pubera]KAJ4785788.1 ARM repeat superfamily protein [Rhynchospora pubera]